MTIEEKYMLLPPGERLAFLAYLDALCDEEQDAE